MPRAAFAEIAGVGVLSDQIDQATAAEVVRQLPRRGFVEPHQRRMQLERPRHAEVERGIERRHQRAGYFDRGSGRRGPLDSRQLP